MTITLKSENAGYVRIVLALGSLYYMPLHPRTCTLLYSISCLLDALDGYAARFFEQSTRFGAVLDMVTDRCTTACLLVFLASAFPRWSIVFQGLISVDLASHYMHMYATLVMGGKGDSHKKVDKSRSYILNLYYTNKVIAITLGIQLRQLTLSRLCSSSSVFLTRSFSSPFTFSRSALHYSRQLSSTSLREMPSPPSQVTQLIQLLPQSTPTHGRLELLSLLVPTRWTPPGHGSSLASPSQSWLESRSSMLSSL